MSAMILAITSCIFRAWTWPKAEVPRNFKKCNCGWSGLPHYAAGAFKCVSWKQIDGWTRPFAMSAR
jgi:hypothetical protein